jgi:S-adenosylmethionine hydrolase
VAEVTLVVSLLTDYGLSDGFVGALHSVIRRASPNVPIIDLTHDIAPQDVRAGSLALLRAAPYLAPGVVVAIVDPGVGTSRRGVAVRPTNGTGGDDAAAVTLVGPDNGLLVPALEALGGAAACVELEDRGYWLPAPGPTFAGRDIFAPAAARLVAGAALEDLGKTVGPGSLVSLPAPFLRRVDGGDLEVEVTWVDRFGNVELAARGEDWLAGTGTGRLGLARSRGTHADLLVLVPGRSSFSARVVRVFGDLAPGELGLLVDSYGYLALCRNGASAAELLGAGEGDRLSLRSPAPRR